jgi:hypothetical protein
LRNGFVVSVVAVLAAAATVAPGVAARHRPQASPLKIRMVSPKPRTVVRGRLHWAVKVSGRRVRRVDFAVDGRVVRRDASAPFGFVASRRDRKGRPGLDTTRLSDGVHTLTAIASNGDSKAAASVAVEVDNTPAPPPASRPAPPASRQGPPPQRPPHPAAGPAPDPTPGPPTPPDQPAPPPMATTPTPTPVPPPASPPVATTAPAISGTPQSGQTLTSSTGTWAGTAPLTFSVAWRRCDVNGGGCVPIAGASGASYTLGSDDVGSTLRATVTATNAAGSGSTDSDPTAPVAAAPQPQAPPVALPPRLFAAASPWNTPIASGAAVDANSPVFVQSIVDAARDKGWLVAAKRWTVPIYLADQGSALQTFSLTADWAPASRISGVPVPAAAAPDPTSDGHLAIVDPLRGCEYDFWKAAKGADGSWSAAWGNALPLDGPGVFPQGVSARGSGFALTAGVIRPGELARGVIDHALVFSYPYTKAGGPVAPATESDGQSTLPGALPEGARLQLDPTLDLSAFGLSSWQVTIARALQRYGMILGDTGGGVSFYAQNPQSTDAAYPWGDATYADLPAQLLSHLRVLQLAPQRKGPLNIVQNACATFG